MVKLPKLRNPFRKVVDKKTVLEDIFREITSESRLNDVLPGIFEHSYNEGYAYALAAYGKRNIVSSYDFMEFVVGLTEKLINSDIDKRLTVNQGMLNFWSMGRLLGIMHAIIELAVKLGYIADSKLVDRLRAVYQNISEVYGFVITPHVERLFTYLSKAEGLSSEEARTVASVFESLA